MSEYFDPGQFISAVEARPPLWDQRLSAYSHKNKKQQCWIQVSREMYPNFDTFSPLQEDSTIDRLKKRWKGIRSSFARELQKQSRTPGPDTDSRKSYVYFDRLSFLLPVMSSSKRVFSHMEDQEFGNPEETFEQESEDSQSQPQDSQPRPAKSTRTSCPEDLPVERVYSALPRPPQNSQVRNTTLDDDRQFLLSLLADFNAISSHFKLDAKIEILTIIKKYKILQQEDPAQHFPPAGGYYYHSPPLPPRVSPARHFVSVKQENVSADEGRQISSQLSASSSSDYDVNN